MKFSFYKLWTDLGAGLFLFLIVFGLSEEKARILAQSLSANQFLKARDMKKGHAIRPNWAKFYMAVLPILALVLAFSPNADYFTVIDVLLLLAGSLFALALSYGHCSSRKAVYVLNIPTWSEPREAKLIPDSDPVHSSTYSADTPPPRNTSTAD